MTRTVPLREKQAWFALADAERCQRLRCSVTERGTQHVDERERLENTSPVQEHVRPVTGGGTSDHVEENERRFAREIVGWLQKKAGERGINLLTIFAPPRIIGALRKPPSVLLKGHLEELQGDLMRLEDGRLAEHPMIRDLVRTADEL